MSLSYISQQLTIYGGLVLFIPGIIGNGINILIFSSIHTYRQTPSVFYFLVSSIINILYILIILMTRILNGFGYDYARTSIIWCKIRQSLIVALGLISYTCSCLATIDQFLVTSHDVRLRRYSNIKWSHRIVFIVIFICCLHEIPVFVYGDIIPPRNACSYNNDIYWNYAALHSIIFLCFIPVLVVSIFGWLTYRNIRRTIALVEQRADRQLVRMTLIQIALIIVSTLPFGIYTTYLLITNGVAKDVNQQIKEVFIGNILSLISYIYYVGSFYVFLISSSRFRRTVKDRILWWKRLNQIDPTQT